jgi:hypothetical protein
VVAGDYLIAPARTAPGAPGPGFDVIDLRTGETHTILLDGLANPLFPSTGPGGSLFPSPDGVDLAVPIQTATNGLPALDIYEMSTGALLRQLEPEVDGSVMSLASSAASSWLSDGIHASLEPCIGAAADSCDYLINPVTGAVRTLVQSNTAAVQDYGSPDGTEEARLSQEVTTTGSRETATVSAGPTGSTLRSVYTSSTAADEMVGALGIDVADDGALMFQTMTVDSKGHPSSVTYVASLGELHRVSLPSVWTLSVPWGCALPGGGFAIEVTRQVGHDTQQEEVLRVSDGGSTTVIQGPTSFASLVGVAS